ncbi:MAG: hypothetical protein A3A81_08210 [Omnitrophica bacterium RIFCSPLOWO2_01_FULL_45_10b]|nr:MAG: hypothetical protein A3A81_08210 [Omnitrophica bacterium RIFCSPLOWO2_01_FULL_45_10b]
MMIQMMKHLMLISIFISTGTLSAFAQTSSSQLPNSSSSFSQAELESSLEEIESLLTQGAFLKAKAYYQILIEQDLPAKDKQVIQNTLEKLNMKILFSPIETPDSFFYTVQAGDSLSKLAKKHHTTVDLIKKSNQLSTDLIRTDVKLKITKAIYSIVVDVSENKLKLFSDGELLRTYPMASGKEGHPTPRGSFTIVTKLENPVWYKTGAVFPPGSPDNILGTRWLGFSLKSYGIHGTTLPETIGTNASEGCLRMYNRDVEELYTVVPLGTAVSIVS